MRNEAETRADLIDPTIRSAGWGEVDGSRVGREYQVMPGRIRGAGVRERAGIADYVLVYRDHTLAVVEAKAEDKPVTEGLAQAKRYAAMLCARFAYSTNGDGIYRADLSTGDEGPVDRYGGRRMAETLRFNPFRKPGGILAASVLSVQRGQPHPRTDRPREHPRPADPGDRDGKDGDSISNCVEALPLPLDRCGVARQPCVGRGLRYRYQPASSQGSLPCGP